MVFDPLYLVVMNLIFPLRFHFIGMNTFLNTRGDNGYHIDLVDICFGTQLRILEVTLR